MGRLIHNTAGKLISKTKEIILAKSLKTIPDGVYFVDPKPPYISQLAGAKKSKIDGPYQKIHDLAAAKRFGAENLDDFSFWAWRSCGIVCIQMIIKATEPNFSWSTMKLVQQGIKQGGYQFKNDLGWYHKSLINLAQPFGINGKTEKFAPIYQIAKHILNNNLVLASVQGIKDGHLLLIYGIRIKNGAIEALILHNPNDFENSGEAQEILKRDFDRISNRRIMYFKPIL